MKGSRFIVCKIFFMGLLLALPLQIISCASNKAILFTAKQCRIPVLLNSVDRISKGSEQAKLPETQKLNIPIEIDLMYQSDIVVDMKTANTIESASSPTLVDTTILQNTLNDPQMNVYVDQMETTTNSWYFIMLVTDRTHILMKGHIDKLTDINDQLKTKE